MGFLYDYMSEMFCFLLCTLVYLKTDLALSFYMSVLLLSISESWVLAFVLMTGDPSSPSSWHTNRGFGEGTCFQDAY